MENIELTEDNYYYYYKLSQTGGISEQQWNDICWKYLEVSLLENIEIFKRLKYR